MNEKQFKYDVAFSFLEEDEDMAVHISNLLEGRLQTFLYSQKQDRVVGTDGEKTFNQVFENEARIVVVLYRSGWGTTSWTRIEETAIRNRAYDAGYDFVIFILLCKEQVPPQWLPKNRIWIDLERFGIEGAANAIKARVQESGGEPKEESITDKAHRLHREIKTEQERRKFLESTEGVRAAKEEVAILFEKLKQLSSQISSSAPSFKLTIDMNDRCCVIWAPGCSLSVSWQHQYINTLNYSALWIQLFDGPISFKNRRAWEEGEEIDEEGEEIDREEFQFDLNQLGEWGWRLEGSGSPLHATCKLAERCMARIMERLKEKELSKEY